LSPQRFTYQQFVLFGRYSLFGYIFQLGILQALRWMGGVSSLAASFVVMMLSALVLTWAATKLVEKLRRTVRIFDATYRVIFA
jgi:hypothetical protein